MRAGPRDADASRAPGMFYIYFFFSLLNDYLQLNYVYNKGDEERPHTPSSPPTLTPHPTPTLSSTKPPRHVDLAIATAATATAGSRRDSLEPPDFFSLLSFTALIII
jgi:hypothetical protein